MNPALLPEYLRPCGARCVRPAGAERLRRHGRMVRPPMVL